MADRISPYFNALPIDGMYALPEDSLDVAFLGSSVVFCGVNPNVIFDAYGYSSYAFGAGMMGINTTLLFMEEALREQHPKAIVVDVTRMAPFFVDDMNDGYQATAWFMPTSAAKLRFAGKLDTIDDKASVIAPIYKFHSRWNKLNANDVRYLWSDKNDFMLGYCGMETVYQKDAFDQYSQNIVDEKRDAALQPYVVEFISEAEALCGEYGAKLVFVTLPSVDAGYSMVYPFYNTLADYLSEKGIPYYGYHKQNERLQLTEADITDTAHLTTSGAKKLSLAIGEDMQKLLSLPDNSDSPDYAYYADCYDKYVALVKSIPGWEALNAF